MASQRFYHVLHVAASAGEHEKVVQVTTLLSSLSRGSGGLHLAVSPCLWTVNGGCFRCAKLEEKQERE